MCSNIRTSSPRSPYSSRNSIPRRIYISTGFALTNINFHCCPPSRIIWQIDISKFRIGFFSWYKIGIFLNANTEIYTTGETWDTSTIFSPIRIESYRIMFRITWWFCSNIRIKAGSRAHNKPVLIGNRYTNRPCLIQSMLSCYNTFSFLVMFKKCCIEQTMLICRRIVNKSQTFLCDGNLYLPLQCILTISILCCR